MVVDLGFPEFSRYLLDLCFAAFRALELFRDLLGSSVCYGDLPD